MNSDEFVVSKAVASPKVLDLLQLSELALTLEERLSDLHYYVEQVERNVMAHETVLNTLGAYEAVGSPGVALVNAPEGVRY